ncbi:MAG TPA: RNA polymerase sigma factor, partial [Tepidisphaeraceae bacterium]|nr:RNA polymerase sigma factor [Tepidisphaeraceae bacterium]
MDRSDEELLRRIRGGETAAFGLLVSRYGDNLYRLAVSLVGSAADAEDVVQETFIGALGRLGAFEGRSSLKTWLTRICVNQASKLRRSRHVRRATTLESNGEEARHDDALASPAATGQVATRIDVMQMLQQLSREHRRVLVLRELEGLSYDEIAGVLAVPRGTVESRLHRARQELKRLYDG